MNGNEKLYKKIYETHKIKIEDIFYIKYSSATQSHVMKPYVHSLFDQHSENSFSYNV